MNWALGGSSLPHGVRKNKAWTGSRRTCVPLPQPTIGKIWKCGVACVPRHLPKKCSASRISHTSASKKGLYLTQHAALPRLHSGIQVCPRVPTCLPSCVNIWNLNRWNTAKVHRSLNLTETHTSTLEWFTYTQTDSFHLVCGGGKRTGYQEGRRGDVDVTRAWLTHLPLCGLFNSIRSSQVLR